MNPFRLGILRTKRDHAGSHQSSNGGLRPHPPASGPPRRDASTAAASEAGRSSAAPAEPARPPVVMAGRVVCPVMLISGCARPTNSFSTPCRVINWHAGNGRRDDVRYRSDDHDDLRFPRPAGRPRQVGCTRALPARQVIATLKCLPGLIERARSGKPATTPTAGESGGIAA
jgi:hypothetical protein